MATIDATVLKWTKLKNGNRMVYISVSHKGKTRFISSGVEVQKASNLKNNRIVKQPDAEFQTMKIGKIIRRYEDRLSEVDTSRYTCAELVELLKGTPQEQKVHTIESELRSYVMSLDKPKSVKLYTLAVKSFVAYAGDKPMQEIDTSDIQGYHNYLSKKRKLSLTTINIYMTLLKIVIDSSIKLKHVSYEVHPFEVYKKPPKNVRDIDITVEEMRRVRDLNLEKYNQKILRDIFMLSYYLAGINIADLIEYNFKGAEQIKYVRKKTEHTKAGNNQICFTIQPEAREIIDRYMSRRTGRLVFGKYDTRSKIDNLIFRQIGNIGKLAGVSKPLKYYSARKSFVQHGFELGIALETIEYCIGQSMKANRPIFNYVKIMSQHADKAIRKVLDNLERIEGKDEEKAG